MIFRKLMTREGDVCVCVCVRERCLDASDAGAGPFFSQRGR